MFITDPPLLADIGQLHFALDNATGKADIYSHFDDGLLNLTILNTSMQVEPLILHLNGISDTIDVLSRFMTFAGNVARDRLVSMSNYKYALKRINYLIPVLLEMIPDEIDISGTDLYIEGGISEHLHVEKDEYITVPLDLSL